MASQPGDDDTHVPSLVPDTAAEAEAPLPGLATGTDDTATRVKAVPPDELVGQVLEDRFELRRPLARGGMAEVYVAWDTRLEVEVAVKLLSFRGDEPDLADLERRFESEAKVLARLADPRILRPISWGRTETGRLFMVSELLSGETLADRLSREHQLSTEDVLDLIANVSRALAQAHESGVIHRDIKPGNLFLQEAAGGLTTLRVLDFGVAKVRRAAQPSTDSDRSSHETTPGMVIGTVPYMSPEQSRGQSVGPLSDLYSLGVVAYQCLTGRLPFSGPATDVLLAHVVQTPPPFRQWKTEVSPEVEELVLWMLEKQPEDRPGSALELAERAEALVAQGTPQVRPSSPPTPSEGPRSRRWGSTVALFVATGVLVFGGLELARWFTGPSEAKSAQVPAEDTAASSSPGKAPAAETEPVPKSKPLGSLAVETEGVPPGVPTEEASAPSPAKTSKVPVLEAAPSPPSIKKSAAPPAPSKVSVKLRTRVGVPKTGANRLALRRLEGALKRCGSGLRSRIEVALVFQPDGARSLDSKGPKGFDGSSLVRCVKGRIRNLSFELDGTMGVMRFDLTP